jgi:hypothetical protein
LQEKQVLEVLLKVLLLLLQSLLQGLRKHRNYADSCPVGPELLQKYPKAYILKSFCVK